MRFVHPAIVALLALAAINGFPGRYLLVEGAELSANVQEQRLAIFNAHSRNA